LTEINASSIGRAATHAEEARFDRLRAPDNLDNFSYFKPFMSCKTISTRLGQRGELEIDHLTAEKRLLHVVVIRNVVDELRVTGRGDKGRIADPSPSHVSVNDVDGNPVQPTPEGAVSPEASDRAIRAHKGVLDEILSFAVTSGERAHEVVDTPTVTPDEVVEGLSAARRSLGH
jgi:hypothetical protein